MEEGSFHQERTMHSTFHIFRRVSFGAYVAAVVVLALSGCGGGSGPRMNTVEGTVTFQGAPVEEGSITFEDSSAGTAGSTTLGPGGTYRLGLPDGNYSVWIQPPMIVTPDTADSPGGEEMKPVDNIPAKYWTSVSSGLTVQISPTATQHDFDLQP
jgi:hypothetical protein